MDQTSKLKQLLATGGSLSVTVDGGWVWARLQRPTTTAPAVGCGVGPTLEAALTSLERSVNASRIGSHVGGE